MDHQSHEPARFWYYYDFSPLQPGRYYCGDCFQLLPAIESGTVDMVLIDPPYYMGKDKAWDCFEGRADYMAFMGQAQPQAKDMGKPRPGQHPAQLVQHRRILRVLCKGYSRHRMEQNRA